MKNKKIMLHNVKKSIEKCMSFLSLFVLMFMLLPSNALASGINNFTYIATTPIFFTGTVKLLAALLTLILGLVGSYVTIQVVIEFFKYIGGDAEEMKLHMKGVKLKAIGGISAVCTSGVIGWMLAFYV